MNRSLAKLAAALLLGSSLAGCSTFDGAQTASSAKDQPAAPHPNTSPKSMQADLDVQILQAQTLRGKGDYAGATQILSQLMLVAPDNPRVVGEYGKNLIQQGRAKESLDFLKRGVQLQPGDWTLYSAMGIAYDQTGDYANAKLAYQQALAIKPGDAGVLNNYALSRMQANDLSGARHLMAQASAGAGASDPKIAQNVALLASLGPTPSSTPAAPIKTAPEQASAKPVAAHQAPPAALGPNVVAQSVPKDPLAGPVKQATAAPRKLAPNAPEAKAPAPSTATIRSTIKPEPHKVAETVPAAKKPVAAKTPSLRMTADVSTP
jgi:Flp pilus assembly protein TadD